MHPQLVLLAGLWPESKQAASVSDLKQLDVGNRVRRPFHNSTPEPGCCRTKPILDAPARSVRFGVQSRYRQVLSLNSILCEQFVIGGPRRLLDSEEDQSGSVFVEAVQRCKVCKPCLFFQPMKQGPFDMTSCGSNNRPVWLVDDDNLGVLIEDGFDFEGQGFIGYFPGIANHLAMRVDGSLRHRHAIRSVDEPTRHTTTPRGLRDMRKSQDQIVQYRFGWRIQLGQVHA